MIEVFRIVHRQIPGSGLIILGEGETDHYKELLLDLIGKYELTEAVSFEGYHTDVETYYSRADVCMVTSEYEGFGMGILESMGAGVPVVMYDLPYLEVVRKGRGLITVKKHDRVRMAKEIVDLLLDVEKKKRLGEEARQAAEEIIHFDQRGAWKSIFTQIESGTHQIRQPSVMWDTMFSHMRMGVYNPGMYCRPESSFRIEEILKSRSYRLARAMTFIPRWIRNKLTGAPM